MTSHATSDADKDDVARALDGDRAAAGALVARHSTFVLRLAAAVCGSSSAADDVAQDAFVKALAALHRYDTSRPFRPWLARIVVNEAHNRRRTESRRRSREEREAARSTPLGASAEVVVVRQIESEHVLRAVAALPPPARDVVACRYFAELSEAETASVLALPVGTVKSRLSRALDALRRQLEQTDG